MAPLTDEELAELREWHESDLRAFNDGDEVVRCAENVLRLLDEHKAMREENDLFMKAIEVDDDRDPFDDLNATVSNILTHLGLDECGKPIPEHHKPLPAAPAVTREEVEKLIGSSLRLVEACPCPTCEDLRAALRRWKGEP